MKDGMVHFLIEVMPTDSCMQVCNNLSGCKNKRKAVLEGACYRESL